MTIFRCYKTRILNDVRYSSNTGFNYIVRETSQVQTNETYSRALGPTNNEMEEPLTEDLKTIEELKEVSKKARKAYQLGVNNLRKNERLLMIANLCCFEVNPAWKRSISESNNCLRVVLTGKIEAFILANLKKADTIFRDVKAGSIHVEIIREIQKMKSRHATYGILNESREHFALVKANLRQKIEQTQMEIDAYALRDGDDNTAGHEKLKSKQFQEVKSLAEYMHVEAQVIAVAALTQLREAQILCTARPQQLERQTISWFSNPAKVAIYSRNSEPSMFNEQFNHLENKIHTLIQERQLDHSNPRYYAILPISKYSYGAVNGIPIQEEEQHSSRIWTSFRSIESESCRHKHDYTYDHMLEQAHMITGDAEKYFAAAIALKEAALQKRHKPQANQLSANVRLEM